MPAVPPYLKPKATKLPAGEDDTLHPPEPATDPETRGVEPLDWPPVDLSRGPTDPPDGPLTDPPTRPDVRTVPLVAWPRDTVPNRPLGELVGAGLGDLDPDIALWPSVIVSRWPFTGPPVSGVWPVGWLGVDNTATVYVCTVAGQPGTWAPLGGGGGGAVASVFGRTGAVTAQSGDYTVGQVTNAQQGPLTGDVTTSGAAATLVGTTAVINLIEGIPAQNFTPTAAWNLNAQRLNNFSSTGWVTDGTVWTRTSNTTFTVPTNLTAIYQTGTVLKWAESSVQKYGIVLSSAFTTVTTVTLVTTSDYVMAASPDGGSNSYANSWLGIPFDFPSSFTWSGAAATGWSSAVTLSNMRFAIKPGRRITLDYSLFGTTSNATTATITGMPIPTSSITNGVAAAQGLDNGVNVAAYSNATPSSTTLTLFRYGLSTAWTASGVKGALGQIEYGY